MYKILISFKMITFYPSQVTLIASFSFKRQPTHFSYCLGNGKLRTDYLVEVPTLPTHS